MDVSKLREKARLRMVPVAYALNISVPHGNEEDFLGTAPKLTGRLAVAFEENLHRLPYTQRKASFAPGACACFPAGVTARAGENPVAYVMDRLGDVYPPVRAMGGVCFVSRRGGQERRMAMSSPSVGRQPVAIVSSGGEPSRARRGSESRPSAPVEDCHNTPPNRHRRPGPTSTRTRR